MDGTLRAEVRPATAELGFDAEEQWRAHLGDAFQDLVPETLDQLPAPRGSLQGRMLGCAALFLVRGSAQIVRRTSTAVRQTPGDLVKVCVQLHGRATVHQDDREVVINPGQLAVYDTARPYALRLEGSWACAVMAVPRGSLGISPDSLGSALHRVQPGRQGPGLVLSGFVTTAVEEADQASPSAAFRLGEAGASLLAGVLADDGGAAAGSASAELRAHVITYIRSHLDDPHLSRGTIAAAHGMSPRTLDRLFADAPWSVSGYIRFERLEAVRRDLASPQLMHRSVAALAARWCFVDAAHFSRIFRQHYGYPPSQVRVERSSSPADQPTPVRR
jgi:AraC-like DNA-binding protein